MTFITEDYGSKIKAGDSQPILSDYVPKRFALQYKPPTIILEYLVPSSGKLYHHKMRLRHMTAKSDPNEMIDYLYSKHSMYLHEKKVAEQQLAKLVNNLKRELFKQEVAKEMSEKTEPDLFLTASSAAGGTQFPSTKSAITSKPITTTTTKPSFWGEEDEDDDDQDPNAQSSSSSTKIHNGYISSKAREMNLTGESQSSQELEDEEEQNEESGDDDDEGDTKHSSTGAVKFAGGSLNQDRQSMNSFLISEKAKAGNLNSNNYNPGSQHKLAPISSGSGSSNGGGGVMTASSGQLSTKERLELLNKKALDLLSDEDEDEEDDDIFGNDLDLPDYSDDKLERFLAEKTAAGRNRAGDHGLEDSDEGYMTKPMRSYGNYDDFEDVSDEEDDEQKSEPEEKKKGIKGSRLPAIDEDDDQFGFGAGNDRRQKDESDDDEYESDEDQQVGVNEKFEELSMESLIEDDVDFELP
eukprot:CAMPEP_0115008548 /NCGR_PEP_ID=MMETSP0216-20121206/22001_1 /TAXON_ID=223996 /ORGANISM="Protocruzia adherens, Strain Boccale" /LENGTH=466 /DNA_ID=CAMNT_0002376023 /DNA_START=119 /DNA_END=1519 /DNA_ORIENTATION=-